MKRQNKWKKLYSCVLAVCLVGTLVLANQSFGVFAEKTEEETTTEQATEQEKTTVESMEETSTTEEKETTEADQKDSRTENVKKQDLTMLEEDKTIKIGGEKTATLYIDKGNITFAKDYVEGYIKKAEGEYEMQRIDYDEETFYIVTQTDSSKKTKNHIQFSGKQTKPYHVVIKDVYMGRSQLQNISGENTGSDSNLEGMISIPASAETKKVYLYLEGKNILNGIRYYTGDEYNNTPINRDSFLKIDSKSGTGMTEGKLYIPEEVAKDEIENFISKTNQAYNRWDAAIGGADNMSIVTGLTIAGGDLQILSTVADNCSAIGGGGNGSAEIDITGGNVYAACNGTGAAIGGGIGYFKYGGNAVVNISGGNVYAKNFGNVKSGDLTVGGVAIGGGSSFKSDGSSSTVKITDGKVQAYAVYGNGIGSGNSAQNSSDKADIQISGGTIHTNAIGGGSSESAAGGSAEIKISGGETLCENLEGNYIGAFGIGGGFSKDGNGGNADVIVNGGILNCGEGTIGGGLSRANGNGGNANIHVTNGKLYAGKIGGGNAEDTEEAYKGGDASINVSGGTLDCASIGGGNSISGTPGSVTSSDQEAGVVVTGGTLKSGTIGGGTNEKGDIGFATANISGGDIQGQFILSNTDTNKKCEFTMTGGTIDNTALSNEPTSKYKMAQENGGAVYLSDPNGLVDISGGTIKNAKAKLGGAIYMEAGEFKFSHEGAIFDCKADQGGAVYLKKGKVAISGGTIGAIINSENHANTADEGGGIYMAGGNMDVSGGRIGYNTADNGAGAYLQAGDMTVSNGATIEHNTSKQNGAGAYLAGGGLTISGGQITANEATQNGGGAYLQAGDMKVLGGQISGNKAQNGAGTYLEKGNLLINGTGSILSNNATQNGGGAYLKTGNLKLDSGSISNNIAQTGGGFYVEGGDLRINDGAVSGNHADNGGGAYVADSTIKMFGGNVSGNKADKNGGAFYVSSNSKAADVLIRSGKLTNNTAGNSTTDDQGNGGAIAVISSNNSVNKDHVIIGLRHEHKNLNTSTREFESFDYQDSKDNNTDHNHKSCPEFTGNQASGNGGGIYMNSSQSILDIYCLLEEKNTATKDSTGGSIMSEGGTVNIGDIGNDGTGNNTETAVGNIYIQSPMLVKGGDVKIYGNTDNPKFADKILVNIQENAGSFHDYRYTQVTGDINYKIEYFENFKDSGVFTSEQYEKDKDIVAIGTMYIHEGYTIIGWNTQKDGKGTMYKTGDLIGSENDHRAWEGKEDTEALTLYAIWEKVSYIVEYNPNADKFSGKMESETFKYDEPQQLKENEYKVTGKRFTGWNTKPDGTGTAYAADYKESKMKDEKGATVTLYAQWADCTHKGGNHPGTLSYTANATNHTITETCDCEGHTATIRISGADVYYDGSTHPASLTTNGEFLETEHEVTYKYKTDQNSEYGNMSEGEKEPLRIGYYKATIKIGEQETSVEYQIKSPADAATIEVEALQGQHFKDFNGTKNCGIAKDDAVTVQYNVQSLNSASNNADDSSNSEVYKTAPILTFNQQLPTGTTIIMQTRKSYWYNNNPSGKEITINDFKKMGTAKETFSYNTSQIDNTQIYRFIIDFSGVKKELYLQNNLEVGLKYEYTNPTTGNLESDKNKEEKATISMNSPSSFRVITSTGRNTGEITVPSNTTNTRWERKNLVWKISTSDPATKLPSDAKLTRSTTVNNEVQTAIYSQNAKGEFIIPFSWANSQNFTFALSSGQEALSNQSYELTAALCVGSKNDGNQYPEAIEDNMQEAFADLTLTIPVTTAPALKISGTEKVLTKDDKLKVNINYENVNGYSINAIIQKKDNNEYKGNYYDGEISNKGDQEITLKSTGGPGSYRLLVTVSTTTGQTLLEVPYYFIVQ